MKQKDLVIGSNGSRIKFNVDSKLSNFWIGEMVPCSIDDAKKLKKWLSDYLKKQEKGKSK